MPGQNNSAIAEKIIVALDVPGLEAALKLVDQIPQASFWKVGLELFLKAGHEILPALKERQKRIFLDLKFHDIPNTVAAACRVVAHYGVDFLTIHTTVGRTGLKAAQQTLRETAQELGIIPPRLLGVTLLTSFSSRELAFDLKIPLELPDYILQMALLAQESGLDGVICSPQEAAQIRQACGDDFLLVCPGIRLPQQQGRDDQQRTLTPKAALQAGANYLVIGRPITQAPDAAQAFWDCASREDS